MEGVGGVESTIVNIRGVLGHPARRRLWLTVGSGGLIAAGLIARYGFGMVDLWSALI
jgi:Zn2+/Cd2+-exporting ATPase